MDEASVQGLAIFRLACRSHQPIRVVG